MVECKTVREHKRNQEKIRKFCLEEAKAVKKAETSSQGQSYYNGTLKNQSSKIKSKQSTEKPKPKLDTKWSNDRLVKLVTQNQQRQQRNESKTTNAPSGTTEKNNSMSCSKPSFNYRAQQAALLESANLARTSRPSQSQSKVSNRSFLIFTYDDAQLANIQKHYNRELQRYPTFNPHKQPPV